jgi:hypothetical protein
MRSLFSLVFLVSGGLGCDFAGPANTGDPVASGEETAIREPGEGGDPVVIVARVLEAPGSPACTARSTYRVAVRYQLIRVVEGVLDEEEILVRQECPAADRPEGNAGAIVTGDVHLLTLDPEPYRSARRVQWIPRKTDLAEG